MTLEVGMQNAGVGTWLVLGLFPDRPEAAIPTAVYTFGCMMTGTVLAQWWGRRTLERNSFRSEEAGSDSAEEGQMTGTE